MHTPILNFVRGAFAISSDDVMVGLSGAMIRRNALHFLSLSVLLGTVLIGMRLIQVWNGEGAGSVSLSRVLFVEFGWVLVYGISICVLVFMKPKGRWCVWLSLAVVLFEGVMVMLRWGLGHDLGPSENTMVGVMIVLSLGASLLPWTPKQTLLVAGIWLIGSTATLIGVSREEGISMGGAIAGYVAVTVPGIMISFFRTTRIKDRFELDYFQSQYERINQELSAARAIHERAFPKPRTTGEVRFAYSYQPTTEIGGDYIFASVSDDDPESGLLIVLLDVSGHGIPAALTVNRLQGELMKVVGEQRRVGPAELIRELDRFISVTSPEDPVLVTGIAARVDPQAGMVSVANAGHPGALIREKSGRLIQIDATGPLMGIGADVDVDWEEEEHPFRRGDSLISFTDGITEAMNSQGDMFGIEGIREVIQTAWIEQGQRWPELIKRRVDSYCGGVVNDDMLIVDVYRPGVD
ncbi:MAG: PP2C family protein-serine/threonine phosphatase [Phycisphaerales bacterium]